MSDEQPSTSKEGENAKTGKKREENRQRTTVVAEPSTLETIRETVLKLFERFTITASSDADAVLKIIPDLTFDGFLKHWKNKGFTKIITMVGAGISTAAGIPDFRSPGSGIYDKLEKYNLPHPQAIFELDFFVDKPQPFFTLAKELYPGAFIPTPTHYFIRLLHEKGLLVRHYTQNIDMLERVAGIPSEILVEAHGTFHTNHCLECEKEYSAEWMKEKIFSDTLPICEDCPSIVKPDIVFFGENLAPRFYELPSDDFYECDLLMIMGTSLEVHPFASLIDLAKPNCVRVLINRTKVEADVGVHGLYRKSTSLLIDSSKNTRDVGFIGDCDEGVWKIAAALGWTDELKKLIDKETKVLRGKTAKEAKAAKKAQEAKAAKEAEEAKLETAESKKSVRIGKQE